MEIELKNIKKNYGKSRVLNNINFAIKEGDILGLIGPNGVGKSTLLRLLAGVLLPNSGEICCEDTTNYESWAHENTFFIPTGERGLKNKLSIYENAIYFCSIKGFDIQETKRRLEKYSKVMNFNDLLHIRFEKMSTGQKKKATLLIGIILSKSLLLLDEPSNGLDINAQNDLINNILMEKNEHKTVVISSHDPGILAPVVDRYVFLKDGVVFKEIKNRIEEKELVNLYHKYYGY